VYVKGTRIANPIIPPYLSQQLVAGHGSAGVFHQYAQKVELPLP